MSEMTTRRWTDKIQRTHSELLSFIKDVTMSNGLDIDETRHILTTFRDMLMDVDVAAESTLRFAEGDA